MVGIGFGWNREEQENHGYPWADRRAMVREKVEAMRELWTRTRRRTGRHVRFAPAWQLPQARAAALPPVYVGGGWGLGLFDEVCQWADGWMPVSARGSLASRLALLDEACERNGRDPAT